MFRRSAWILVLMLVAFGSAWLVSGSARSQEPSENPFVGVACDPSGRWLAVRAHGEVYVSEGKSWLDRMEYRYTIETLETPYKIKQR